MSALLGDAAPEAVLAGLVAPASRCGSSPWTRPALEDVFVALTGEGFDVSG